MKEYIDTIKNKFGYKEDLCEFLEKVLPIMINHFGDDKREQILKTFSNVEIHIEKENETYEDFVRERYGPSADTYHPVGAAGVHIPRVRADENKNIIEDHVVYAFKTIGKGFSFDNVSNVSTLIHEMCHALKGYGNYAVVGDQIVSTTGFRKHYADLSGNEIEAPGEIGVGLDEAFNCYDEEVITSAFFGIEYKAGSYSHITDVIGELMEHEDIREAVRIAQFSNPLLLEIVLGTDNYKQLTQSTYDIVTFSYMKDSDIVSQDEDELMEKMVDEGYSMDEIMAKLDEILASKDIYSKISTAFDAIHNIAENHTSDKSLSDFNNALMNANAKTLEAIASRLNENSNLETSSKTL